MPTPFPTSSKAPPEIELRLVFPTIDDKYMKDMYGLGGAPLDEREDVFKC